MLFSCAAFLYTDILEPFTLSCVVSYSLNMTRCLCDSPMISERAVMKSAVSVLLRYSKCVLML